MNDGDVVLGDIAKGFHLPLRSFACSTDTGNVVKGMIHVLFFFVVAGECLPEFL